MVLECRDRLVAEVKVEDTFGKVPLFVLTFLFFSDDIVQRLQVLFVLICLFGFTINLTYAFDNTYTALIAFYVS